MTTAPRPTLRLLPAAAARPDLLSPEESARLAAFRHEARRRGFVLGRAAARTLLAESLGCSPEAVPLAVGADGAPEVQGAPLHVSIAHAAGDLGGAAIASRAVGLDLEAIRQRRPDLWRRMLRPDEYAVLEALGGPTDETQTLLWSLKEAVLKGRRTGLRAGMHSVRLHQLASGVGEGRDAEGGAWRLGYERRGDLWVTWALAE